MPIDPTRYRALLPLTALALVLPGCSAEPVVLAEDAIEAAKTCFAAKALVMREGKGEDDPITFDEYMETLEYPYAAAALTEPFDLVNAEKALEGIEAELERVGGLDYEGAVALCDARFGFAEGGKPALPESDLDAQLACTSVAALAGAEVEGGSEDHDTKAARYSAFADRLATDLDTQPEIITATEESVETMMEDQLVVALKQGRPQAYLTQCEARFPEG